MKREDGLKARVFADPELTAIRAFGLVHARGGPGGKDIAVPAHVLVARGGVISSQWRSGSIQDRRDPKEILQLLHGP